MLQSCKSKFPTGAKKVFSSLGWRRKKVSGKLFDSVKKVVDDLRCVAVADTDRSGTKANANGLRFSVEQRPKSLGLSRTEERVIFRPALLGVWQKSKHSSSAKKSRYIASISQRMEV